MLRETPLSQVDLFLEDIDQVAKNRAKIPTCDEQFGAD